MCMEKRFDEKGQQGGNIFTGKISREGNVRGQENSRLLMSFCGVFVLKALRDDPETLIFFS